MEPPVVAKGEGIGLLHRVSLGNEQLKKVYVAIRSRGVAWDVTLDKLFGGVAKDEFIGYGRREIPGHDALGRYPMFTDVAGRQYFGDQIERPMQTPFSDGISLAMRIPRWLSKTTDFPEPGSMLEMYKYRTEMFQYCWDDRAREVRLLKNCNQKLFEKRKQSVIMDQFEYQQKYSCVVKSLSQHRESTAVITLVPSQTWTEVYWTLREAWHDTWFDPIVELILAIDQPSTLETVCTFLQFALFDKRSDGTIEFSAWQKANT